MSLLLLTGDAAESGNGGNLAVNTAVLFFNPHEVTTSVSTPDLGASDPKRITGDIDMRALVALNTYTGTQPETIWARQPTGDRSYSFYIMGDGTIGIVWTENGIDGLVITSTEPLDVSDGNPIGVRAVLDVDNGSNQRVGTFYSRPFPEDPRDNEGWEELGDPVIQANATSIWPGESDSLIGLDQHFTRRLSGHVFMVVIKDGINGTTVASPDFTNLDLETESFEDDQGNVYTLNGNTEIVTWP